MNKSIEFSAKCRNRTHDSIQLMQKTQQSPRPIGHTHNYRPIKVTTTISLLSTHRQKQIFVIYSCYSKIRENLNAYQILQENLNNFSLDNILTTRFRLFDSMIEYMFTVYLFIDEGIMIQKRIKYKKKIEFQNIFPQQIKTNHKKYEQIEGNRLKMKIRTEGKLRESKQLGGFYLFVFTDIQYIRPHTPDCLNNSSTMQ